MLYHALKDWVNHGVLSDDYWLLVHNGGENTFEGWMSDGEKEGWIKYLRDLPLFKHYTNENGIEFLLSHAGFNPNKTTNNYNLLWGREHLPFPWYGASNQIVFHGHTPNIYIAQELEIPYDEPGALYYCGNHKIGLDTSCYKTNFAVVLDLDTLDEHIFYVDKEKTE